ncbi:TKL/LISK/LIMK protein kinase [Salpingoeca rosetta]|uniref:non-specific serine/threonine protein kinase n=1 Tax=Salpingoeca rosetta (strain ATCC 50818 / BSB-021) TaxID=946362 RepID=F2UEG2_SALR5|nr:TKL/LISK/LIMK protein kinase [Salpingoeca rosetta]EGD75012.1 TKL/LISK/LIMK protein kinase [Salpingoeca rosetta]|eukprot:XP_004992656.1 TKL/LISK/LIMK protein kinase [Salpingoeca rosetta]
MPSDKSGSTLTAEKSGSGDGTPATPQPSSNTAPTPSTARRKRRFLFFRLGDELIGHKPKKKLPFRLLRRSTASSPAKAGGLGTVGEAGGTSDPAQAAAPSSSSSSSPPPSSGKLSRRERKERKSKRKEKKKKDKAKDKDKDERNKQQSPPALALDDAQQPSTTDSQKSAFASTHITTQQQQQQQPEHGGEGADGASQTSSSCASSASAPRTPTTPRRSTTSDVLLDTAGDAALPTSPQHLGPIPRPSGLSRELSISGAMSSAAVAGVTATAFDRAAARSMRMSRHRHRRPSIFDEPITHVVSGTVTVRRASIFDPSPSPTDATTHDQHAIINGDGGAWGRARPSVLRRAGGLVRSTSASDLFTSTKSKHASGDGGGGDGEEEKMEEQRGEEDAGESEGKGAPGTGERTQNKEGEGSEHEDDVAALLTPVESQRPKSEQVFTPEAMGEGPAFSLEFSCDQQQQEEKGKEKKEEGNGVDEEKGKEVVKQQEMNDNEQDNGQHEEEREEEEEEAPVLDDPSTEERHAAARSFRHSWHGRTAFDETQDEADVDELPSSVFRITDLEVGRVLGKGFYGRVLQCTHKYTGETVVVKELIRTDSEAKALFVQEMSLLKKLKHRNVLRFIGIFYSNDKLHLVTEYVDNGTLRNHILNEAETLPWDLRVQMVRDVALGMEYLHGQSIIHRDLKTENCLVRHDMSIVLCDFGLARVMKGEVFKERRSLDRGLTHSMRVLPAVSPAARAHMTVVGTPDWMAPEMIMSGDYNQSADVFSFGLIVCSLIARMDPDPDLIRTHTFGLDHAKFRSKYAGDSPEELLQLAFQATAFEPENRPSFSELSARLYLIDLQTSCALMNEADQQQHAHPHNHHHHTLSLPDNSRARAFTNAQ